MINRLDPEPEPDPRRMHLSQQMLQNLELLQLPIMELKERIDRELGEQERKDDPEDPKAK